MCVSYQKVQIARVTNGILLTEAHTQKHQNRKHGSHEGKASAVIDPQEHLFRALALALYRCAIVS